MENFEINNLVLESKDLATNQQVKEVSQKIIDTLQEGWGDPLKVQVFFSAVEKVGKAVKDAIREMCIEEVSNRGERGRLNVLGADIEIAETGVKYDYSVIPSWARLQAQIDELKAQQKEIEGKAKFASERSPYLDLDTETGAITELPGISKTSTTAVKVTLGKGK